MSRLRSARSQQRALASREESVQSLREVLHSSLGIRQRPPEQAQAGAALLDAPAHHAPEAQPGALQIVAPLQRVGGDHLRRRGGGRRAPVGDEVRNREVDLVPDAGDQRNRAAMNRACDRFVVEAPQILDRTAPSSEHEHVALRSRGDALEHLRDSGRRPAALNGNRVQDCVHAGKAPPHHGQDVAQGGAGRRGDDPDARGHPGDGLLRLVVEEPFVAETLLQRLEGPAQRARSRFLEVVHDELELATLGVEADPDLREHLHSVDRLELQVTVLHSEHRAAHLAPLVLQREVQVAGSRAGEIRDFSLDPQGRKAGFDETPRLEVEPRHGVDVAHRRFDDVRAAGGRVHHEFTGGGFLRRMRRTPESQVRRACSRSWKA